MIWQMFPRGKTNAWLPPCIISFFGIQNILEFKTTYTPYNVSNSSKSEGTWMPTARLPFDWLLPPYRQNAKYTEITVICESTPSWLSSATSSPNPDPKRPVISNQIMYSPTKSILSPKQPRYLYSSISNMKINLPYLFLELYLSQLHHYDDLRSCLQILFNQRNMFASETHEQNGQSSPRNVSASDLALFEELESVGPAPCQVQHKSQQSHQWTHSFLRPEGSPRLLPLNQLHDGHRYQAEPSLFSKLSADISQQSLSLHSSSQKQSHHRFQNDTKNIPKNFGKGILNFIQKNEAITREAAKRCGVPYVDLLRYVRGKKGSISTIAELRELWTEAKMGRCMRVLSNLFLRKYALGYIFNSRIVSFGSHVKYRSALWEALHRPEDFNHIKKY